MTTKAEPVAGVTGPIFLNIDGRVPATLRDLLSEADGCLKMGFLLGGTVCAQRAMQALLTIENIEGSSDESRLRNLSEKYPAVPKVLFAVCARCQTSPNEQTPLDKERLNLLLVTLKLMLHEIFVIARDRMDALEYLQKILERLEGDPASTQSPSVLAFSKS